MHALIVPCNEDILADLRGGKQAQTTSEDNFETMSWSSQRLVGAGESGGGSLSV